MTAAKKTFRYGDHTVTLETGIIARQACAQISDARFGAQYAYR